MLRKIFEKLFFNPWSGWRSGKTFLKNISKFWCHIIIIVVTIAEMNRKTGDLLFVSILCLKEQQCNFFCNFWTDFAIKLFSSLFLWHSFCCSINPALYDICHHHNMTSTATWLQADWLDISAFTLPSNWRVETFETVLTSIVLFRR